MGQKRSFRDDQTLKPILDSIPSRELSTHIRLALRDYFGLTNSKKGVVGYVCVRTPESLPIAKKERQEESAGTIIEPRTIRKLAVRMQTTSPFKSYK